MTNAGARKGCAQSERFLRNFLKRESSMLRLGVICCSTNKNNPYLFFPAIRDPPREETGYATHTHPTFTQSTTTTKVYTQGHTRWPKIRDKSSLSF